MKTVMTILTLVSIPLTASAAGMECSYRRPYDPNPTVIRLQQGADSKYDVISKSKLMPGGDADHSVILEKGMDCIFSAQDPMVVSCTGSPATEITPTGPVYHWFETKKIVTSMTGPYGDATTNTYSLSFSASGVSDEVRHYIDFRYTLSVQTLNLAIDAENCKPL